MDLENTFFAIIRYDEGYLSQIQGNIMYFSNFQNLINGVQCVQRILDVDPVRIGLDMHLDYQVSRWARQQNDRTLVVNTASPRPLSYAMIGNLRQREVMG